MKKHLLKSMFLMAMMAIGANAWADAGDVTVNADIDFSNAIVEGVVKGTVNQMVIGTGGAESIIQDGWLRLGDHANVVTIDENERAGARDVVTISFKMAFGNKKDMGSGFRVKDAEGKEIATYQHARWNGNPGNTLGIDMSGLVGGHSSNRAVAANATSYEIVFDYAKKQIVSTLTLGSTTKEFTAELTSTNPIATFEVYGYGAGGNADRASIFDDLKITTTEGNYNVQSAAYTVNFVCNGTTVETAERTGDVGDAISLLASDKEPRTIEGQKYFYVSDDAEGKTVAADSSTVITVTLREAEIWNYVFNATLNGEVLKAFAEGTVVEGEPANATWPRYVLNGNKLAYRDALNNSYNVSFTPAANNAANDLAYGEFADASNVVFFAEAEDIASLEPVTDLYLPARFSAGRGAYAKQDGSVITSVVKGKKYKLTARLMGTQSVATFKFRVGDRVIWQHSTSSTSFYPGTDSYGEEFVVASDADITLDAAGGVVVSGRVTNTVDYIYLEELGDATEEELAEAAEADVVAEAERAWEKLIAEAKALVDADAVAVGLLQDAIAAAEAVAEPADADKEALQAAIDLFKKNNADQEKDQTTKVNINGWKKFDGSAAGLCATQYAPAITTYDGRTAQLAEVFEGNGNRTGTIIYQDITGLENGKYKVGFYGNAFSTSQRDGFECTMEDGAEDVAYVFANNEKAYIVAHIATATTENDFRQFDVEVTDGAIKLGMGKDTEKSTNWHTMQIYQLTWFTTAKEVYAQDKAEMSALLAAADQLVNNAAKVNGKEDFQAAIEAAKAALANNRLNLTEFETEIAKFAAAIAAFRSANYLALNGTYYVAQLDMTALAASEGNGIKLPKMMAAGHDWGTRAIVSETGLDLKLAANESNKVTFDSQVSNGGDSHFLGSNLYMDAPAYAWAIEAVDASSAMGEGGLSLPGLEGLDLASLGVVFATISNEAQYLAPDADDNLALSETPAVWVFIPAEVIDQYHQFTLTTATAENPVDATFLLKNPNFNRNDQRVSAWEVTFVTGNNKNLNGGNNVNNCAESFHAAFTVSQVAAGAPKGTYELTAQGFFRQDDNAEEAAPTFFLNDTKAEVPAKTGSENSMSQASESFTAGLYTIEPIKAFINDDETLNVGITNGENVHQWVIFDNFRLTYYGTEDLTTGITELTATEQVGAEAIYNLQGQKLQKTVKGLNIVGGKKIIVK